jgi:hypothetical protein
MNPMSSNSFIGLRVNWKVHVIRSELIDTTVLVRVSSEDGVLARVALPVRELLSRAYAKVTVVTFELYLAERWYLPLTKAQDQ